MDRGLVADFYRGKGYKVHEAALVTGHSGNGHRVPLLAEGPLGNLAIFFGDAGGADLPEMGGARRVAKDLGATPVLAASSFTNSQRNAAAELGVVLLDADAVTPETPPAPPAPAPVPTGGRWPDVVGPAPVREPKRSTLTEDFAAHPWPDSGRPGGRDGAHAKAIDVDDLLRGYDRTAREAPAPTPVPAPPVAPVPATRVGEDGLWKRPRATAAVVATPQPTARAASATAKFGWLGLPANPTAAVPPLTVELEQDTVLRARQPAVAADTPTDAMAQLHADVDPEVATAQLRYARFRRRTWIRRVAWLGGVGLFLYLFLLWWL